jgi:hypothetical protein
LELSSACHPQLTFPLITGCWRVSTSIRNRARIHPRQVQRRRRLRQFKIVQRSRRTPPDGPQPSSFIERARRCERREHSESNVRHLMVDTQNDNQSDGQTRPARCRRQARPRHAQQGVWNVKLEKALKKKKIKFTVTGTLGEILKEKLLLSTNFLMKLKKKTLQRDKQSDFFASTAGGIFKCLSRATKIALLNL